ncbi:MAG TPA: hypothetical protein VKX46_02685 [Ktedonobacteraceae bacterium]|nr:hypothetical protein [Ktedonobacteraceae bacterium]
MNDLLKLLPDDDTIYVGELLNTPSYNVFIKPAYSLLVRQIKGPIHAIGIGPAQLMLANGETIPITVIGDGMIRPHPKAVQSGTWQPLDASIFIKDTDLTPEQATLVRLFIQR